MRTLKKIFAILALTAMLANNIGSTYAATDIGDINITGWSSTDVIWDDALPGYSTGTSANVTISARVVPILTMTVSTGVIDLGDLSYTAYVTGSLDIEIGTNARNGVIVSVVSASGGLTNDDDNSFQVNNLVADGIAESYKFNSEINAVADSSVAGFASTANLDTEISSTASNVVYSTNKEEADNGVDDFTFKISSKIDAQTPSGTYGDTISFTVTWSF